MNTENALFTLYYQDDEMFDRVAFRDRVMRMVGCHRATFYRWVNGESDPSDLEKSAIVRCYNKTRPPHFPAVTVTQLFESKSKIKTPHNDIIRANHT